MISPTYSRESAMIDLNRRLIFVGGSATAALSLAGCNTTATAPATQIKVAAGKPAPTPVPDAVRTAAVPAGPDRYQALYKDVPDKFPVTAIKPGTIPEAFWRSDVDFRSSEAPGTIVVDPRAHYLYFIQGNGRATRYGVGVGKEGFGWNGVANINSKQEWPDWYPPPEMIERDPSIKARVGKLQSGIGVPGGPHNPLGARAMYLWQNNKDTLFRIHGTLEPWTIGKNVSSGCIRMVNQDAIDLYGRVAVGTTVKVL
jgi:lipoprotein-anchoring transpeptidase ErfK/SrfK